MNKKEKFLALREMAMNHPELFEDTDMWVEWFDHEVEQLDKRTDSAKKYAKKKSAESDALVDAIAEVLSNVNEAMTIPEIVAALPADLGATPQKLTYRLNKMVEAKSVIRDSVSIKEEDKKARKVNCYKWYVSDEE